MGPILRCHFPRRVNRRLPILAGSLHFQIIASQLQGSLIIDKWSATLVPQNNPSGKRVNDYLEGSALVLLRSSIIGHLIIQAGVQDSQCNLIGNSTGNLLLIGRKMMWPSV